MFNPANVDLNAFRPFDLASAFANGQAVRRNAQYSEAAERELADDQEFRKLMGEHGGDMSSPGLLTEVARRAPSFLPQVAHAQQQHAQALQQLEQDQIAQFQRKKQVFTEVAKNAANRFYQLPEQVQGDPKIHHALLLDAQHEVAQFAPDLAADFSVDPGHFANFLGLSGVKDPRFESSLKQQEKAFETEQEIRKNKEVEDYKNRLPPSMAKQWETQQSIEADRWKTEQQLKAEAEKARLDREAKGQEQQQTNQRQMYTDMDNIRKEFQALPEVKNYRAMVPMLKTIQQAAKENTPAADLNLIYGVAKTLDPEGVVRESDSDMVIKAGSPAQRLEGMFRSIVGGGRLTPDQKKDLIHQMESRVGAMRQSYDTLEKSYSDIVHKRGFDPYQILIEPGRFERQAETMGQVVKPAQPKNYVRTGRLPDGRRVGQLPDGTMEVLP